MVISTLIFGILALLLVLGITAVITPCLTPCATVLLGLAAGYVALAVDKPQTMEPRIKKGALAGGLAGIGAALGQVIGGIINGVWQTSSGGQQFFEGLGLPMDSATIWTSQIIYMCVLVVVHFGIMAGLGAAGAAIWSKMHPVAPPPPASPTDYGDGFQSSSIY